MATKRRSPGVLPPRLTKKQAADADRCFPIAVRVAKYYAKRRPAGLTYTDLLSTADEALVVGVSTHAPSKGALEPHLWSCIRRSLKTLIKKKAEELGRRSDAEPDDARIAEAGRAALDDYGRGLQDRGDVWDEPEQLVAQWEEVRDEGALALGVGGAGCVWHMRGEAGFAQREARIRAIRFLRKEVAALRAELATVMELRWFREQQLAEVAAAMGVSVPTVTRLIVEAIGLLRARLKAHGVDASVLDDE